ncbi:MAG: aminotransferase class I/II-fold pyridoxal phosphate-dependent enzyme, partial [Desulfobacteraceae bacterium]|nr:aminotransferase class I/II-fold pyridoxal phosphate-dependent enzyme [Desulfobacteraceae bacterium]
RTCVVYSVNAPAQVAALAALQDAAEHVLRTKEFIRAGKAMIEREIKLLGLPYVLGEGNFVMIKLPINDALAYRKLMAHGVMVRGMSGFRYPGWIRVTISFPEAMEAFAEALGKILPRERDAG